MNSLEAAVRRIASELDRQGRRWALVSGLAVSARAEPRTTRDVDVVVEVADDADAESLVRALQAAGFRILAALEQDAVRCLATVRLAVPGGTAQGAVVAPTGARSSGPSPRFSTTIGGLARK